MVKSINLMVKLIEINKFNGKINKIIDKYNRNQ